MKRRSRQGIYQPRGGLYNSIILEMKTGLRFQKSCDDFRQLLGVVLVHHVAGAFDRSTTIVRDYVISFLFVGAPRLAAFLAIDD